MLSNAVFIKVHYLEEQNKVLITEYYDPNHQTAKEYDEDYEEILYEQHCDDLRKTLKLLNIAIKNHEIIDTKLYIRDSEIHFKNNYTNRSDYTIHSEELVCKIENVDTEEIYSTLSNIRNIAFNNSHLVKSLLDLDSRV